MKNGLFSENGELVYYKDGHPVHAGVIEVDGDIYYIGRNGVAVKGEYVVHGSMSNGILKRGTYRFGSDGKLVKDFYVAPKKYSKKSKKSFFHVKKAFWVVLLSVVGLTIVSFLIVLPHLEKSWMRVDKEESSEEIIIPEIIFEKPGENIALCSSEFMKFYNGEISLEDALIKGNPYNGLTLEYEITNGKDGVFLISETEDMKNAETLKLADDKHELQINNLKTNTVYFYRVSCGETVIKGSFKTLPSNRFVSIQGLTNGRDIGGYKTNSGKTVKQGVIIRGGEIDGLVSPSYFLNKDNAEAFVEDFGLVYDFDLRSRTLFMGDFNSHLGINVKHEFYDFPFYGGIFSEGNRYILKNVFSDLANEENYPMYLHCTHGADRTGVLVYLIQGILGVPEEEMMNEYRLTAFYNSSYLYNENMNIVVSALNNYEGDTINEKIENYLVNFIGVTEEEIESIRKILLE